MVKAAIYRGKPGIQIKVEKKSTKGTMAVKAGTVTLWSETQKLVKRSDLSIIEQTIRKASGGCSRENIDAGDGSGSILATSCKPKKSKAQLKQEAEAEMFASIAASSAAASKKQTKKKKK